MNSAPDNSPQPRVAPWTRTILILQLVLAGVAILLDSDQLRAWAHILFALQLTTVALLVVRAEDRCAFLFSPSFLMVAYISLSYAVGAYAFSRGFLTEQHRALLTDYADWQRLKPSLVYVLLCNSAVSCALLAATRRRRERPVAALPRAPGHVALYLAAAAAIFVLFKVFSLRLGFFGSQGSFSGIPRVFATVAACWAAAASRAKWRFAVYLALTFYIASFSYMSRREAAVILMTIVFLEAAHGGHIGLNVKVLGGLAGAVVIGFVLVTTMTIMRYHDSDKPGSYSEAFAKITAHFSAFPQDSAEARARPAAHRILSRLAQDFECDLTFYHANQAMEHVLGDPSLHCYGATIIKPLFIPIPRRLWPGKPQSMIHRYTNRQEPGLAAGGGAWGTHAFVEYFWNFHALGIAFAFLLFLVFDKLFLFLLDQIRLGTVPAHMTLCVAYTFFPFYARGSGLDIFTVYILLAAATQFVLFTPLTVLGRALFLARRGLGGSGGVQCSVFGVRCSGAGDAPGVDAGIGPRDAGACSDSRLATCDSRPTGGPEYGVQEAGVRDQGAGAGRVRPQNPALQQSGSSRTLTIVHVVDYLMPTLGYQEFLLPKWNARHGHSVHIVTSDRYAPIPDYEQTWGELLGPRLVGPGTSVIEGVTVHRLPTPVEPKGRPWLRGLTSAVAALDPDALFCHGTGSFSAFRTARLAFHRDIPLFMDNHMVFSCRTRSLPGRIYYLLQSALSRLVLAPNVTRFFGVAEECCEFLAQEQRIPREQVECLPLGVDTDLFKPRPELREQLRREHSIPEQATVVMQTGKLSPDKGPHVLTEAVAPLMQERGDLHLVLVGAGAGAYLNEVCGPLEACGVAERLHILPFVPANRLAELYAAADLAVYPMAASLSCLEAAACGVPVIMTDLPASRWRAEQGVGCCYRTGDVEDLRRLVRELVTDSAKRTEAGEKARQAVAERFSYDTIATYSESLMLQAL